jgi:flagellar basal-body rod protein FlgB
MTACSPSAAAELQRPQRATCRRAPFPPSLTVQDNNNRSIEHEMMEITKNSMMESFAIELMNAQFNMLQAAIREQV